MNCPTDNLQNAINAAPAGAKLLVEGTCTGNFAITNNVTLSGPATLDGGGVATTYGATLNVISGTVVLNNLVIEDGVGIDGLGGGLWNGGQLTLNHTSVSHNNAFGAGGVFNMGQLVLKISSVSNNTATGGNGGGIFNCGTSLQAYGLCTGAPATLTLNSSVVSNNVGGTLDGGGIANDTAVVTTLNVSIVSGNTTPANGGGIENHGTATLNLSTVSDNTGSSGGGMMNNGTATSTGPRSRTTPRRAGRRFFGGGGGLSNGVADTGSTTLNYSLVRANTAAFVVEAISPAGAR